MALQSANRELLIVRLFDAAEAKDWSAELSSAEIHVWRLDIGKAPTDPADVEGLLSQDELARAQRFRLALDRKNFILSRGVLRRLLGNYLAVEPRELRFVYSEFGRPLLEGSNSGNELHFNVSHSGDMILWAFSHKRRIGVDVERVRRDFSTLEISERFFSPAERAVLRQLPTKTRYESFFRCWTRKEAFIKALGEGLSHPLDQFDVTLAPGDPAKLLATRPIANDAKCWQMWDIAVPSGYAAALIAQLR
jgi:4'-phosphopantetheinyl transferase